MRQTTNAPLPKEINAPNVAPIQAAANMLTTGILLMVGGFTVLCGCLAFALLSN